MRVGALIEGNANINPTSFTQILESPDILPEMPKLLALPWTLVVKAVVKCFSTGGEAVVESMPVLLRHVT